MEGDRAPSPSELSTQACGELTGGPRRPREGADGGVKPKGGTYVQGLCGSYVYIFVQELPAANAWTPLPVSQRVIHGFTRKRLTDKTPEHPKKRRKGAQGLIVRPMASS